MSVGFSNNPVVCRGICKLVLSGDAIIVRNCARNGPPKERQLNLSNVTAPRLARRAAASSASTTVGVDASVDEPCAWQSREFLRQKLVGREVLFTVELATTTGREYANVYLGADIATGENVIESLVAEGLVQVRRDSGRDTSRLCELEATTKAQGRGKWAPDAAERVRSIIWSVDNPRELVEKFGGAPVSAVIEHVRDGSTVRAFLLPDMYHVTVMLSGVRAPMTRIGIDNKPDPNQVEPFFEMARFFVESRLLQRDVHIILESVNNANYVGSVLHPNGNIAELLLREGLARCVDWSIAHAHCGANVLRDSERSAKEKRLRIWKDYTPTNANLSIKDKEFSGKVMEVVNGDAMVIKMSDNTSRKVFLSSVRPPRADKDATAPTTSGKTFRPLYDVPFLFEAREYLRRKAVGQKVQVHVDYVQPANDLPERCCCTVKLAGVNLAEALVGRGLATVVRYRPDEERRSSHYDALLAAEMKAQKSANGMFGRAATRGANATVKVQDCCGDVARAKQFFPFLQRVGRVDGVVEFVASGSRVRVFVARETCLLTLLLAGVSCPRGTRPAPGGGGGQLPAEPYGDQAAEFTRELCLQREVQLEVDSMDKGGNFIGWLTTSDGRNLSVELVAAGLAKMHFSAENSVHATAIQRAEEQARTARKNLWKNYVPEPPSVGQLSLTDDAASTAVAGSGSRTDAAGGGGGGPAERKLNYRSVVVTEVGGDAHFFAQMSDKGPELETMMNKMRAELTSNPPLPGAYRPKRGDLCAAKFAEDGEWYRARVERLLSASEASVMYIDYGNRATIATIACAPLPAGFAGAPRFAREYALALCRLPADSDAANECRDALAADICGRQLQMNVEYRGDSVGGGSSALEYVTLRSEGGGGGGGEAADVARQLLVDGLMLAQRRRPERRLQRLLADYQQAQETAQRAHTNIWRYGDITEDDAAEFGR